MSAQNKKSSMAKSINNRYKYISFHPKILGGAAVITGTRVPMSRIIFLLKEGYSPEVISEETKVEKKKVSGAIDEVAKNLERPPYVSPLY